MANKDIEKKEDVLEPKQDSPVKGEETSSEPETDVQKGDDVEDGKEKDAQKDEQKEVAAKPKKKKKLRRQVQRGRAYINSTYNNTVVSLTDLHGNLLAWSSSGLLGFKGAKKATTFAANQVVMDVSDKVEKYGLKDIEVYVKGVGSGREAAIRALAQRGFNLSMIKDKTPIPHNGCRPKKPRRV